MMGDIYCMNPKDLSVLVTTIAIIIAEDKTADELNVLGNVLTSIASLILTIAAQQQSLETLQQNSCNKKDK